MRFLISGCGSIGRRHARNLLDLGLSEVVVHDTDQERLSEVARETGAKPVDNFTEELDRGAGALLVCTPTNMHVGQAFEAANRGIPVFIEKPLSHDMAGVDQLLMAASSHGSPLMVGCNFRFDSGFKTVKQALADGAIGRPVSARSQFGQYLPDWRPYHDYRQSYSAQQSMGGGIILDSVHEFDYLTLLLGKPETISSMAGRLGDLEIDTEDVAEILFYLDTGIIASLHVDYLRRGYDRSLEVVGTDGVLRWRFQDNYVGVYNPGTDQWQILSESKEHDFNTMYVDEMRHFIEVAAGRATPAQDGWRAKQVLEMALRAKDSAAVLTRS